MYIGHASTSKTAIVRKGNQLNLHLGIRGNIISQHVTPNMTELLRRVKIISDKEGKIKQQI